MAIRNTQQARQMYKKGSKKPVKQAGVMNYMPSEMVTVPKIAKSSPNTPTAKLAYITPEEQDILVNLNLYGSLDGKPNRGPGGLPSLEGDFGPGGNNPGGFEGGGGGRGDRDTVGTTDRGTGDYQVTDTKAQQDYNRSRAIRDFNRTQVENIGKKKNPIATFFGNLPTPFNIARKFASKFGPLNNFDFYNEKVVPAGKKTFRNYEDYMSQRLAGKIDAYGNPIDDDDNNNNMILPVDTTFSQAPVGLPAAVQPIQTMDLNRIAYRFMADGGFLDEEDEPRQAYGLGSIVRKITRPIKKVVKKATKAVKKVAKSPLGKLAIAVAAPYALGPAVGQMKALQALSAAQRAALISGATTGITQLASGEDLDLKDIALSAAIGGGTAKMFPGNIPGKPVPQGVSGSNKALFTSDAAMRGTGFGAGDALGGEMLTGGAAQVSSIIPKAKPIVDSGTKSTGILQTLKDLGTKVKDSKLTDVLLKGDDGKISPMKSILLASALSGLAAKKDQKPDEFSEMDRGEGIDITAIRRRPFDFMAPRFAGSEFDFYAAEGGQAKKEPVAKKVMPLLDMGGMEKDYRAEGGFVPIGRMEKADDVPARLSKNEFVFTADAVRNAGDGDVDKGAEVMYNMMKNLEAGGDVSEESQGLKGARRMFQTSQRLEEVL
jgi:hypothetical protein